MRTTVRASVKALLVIAGTTGFVALGAGAANATVLGEAPSLGDLGAQAPQLLGETLSDPLGGMVSIDPEHPSNDPELQHHSGAEDNDLAGVFTNTLGVILEDTRDELGGMVDTHQVRPDLVELHGDAEDTGTVSMAGGEEPDTPHTGQKTDPAGGSDDPVAIEGLPELGNPSQGTEVLPQSAVSDLSEVEDITGLLPGSLV